MSVGGKVIEVIPGEDRVWVNTLDYSEKCAIYVQRNNDSEQIKAGDSLWWQGREAYWTPQDAHVIDHPIPRIGFSGVERPK